MSRFKKKEIRCKVIYMNDNTFRCIENKAKFKASHICTYAIVRPKLQISNEK